MRENKADIVEKPDHPSYAHHPSGLRRGIEPKTDFGRELLEIRRKALADGMKERNADEILAEIEENRRF